MSAYKYTASNDNALRIRGGAHHARTWVSIGPPDGGVRGVHIPNTDAPTVAAELLKAAGYPVPAELIEAAEKAEAEAAEKKLQERRDEAAQGFSPYSSRYNEVSVTAQAAIDAYLKTEDKLASRD